MSFFNDIANNIAHGMDNLHRNIAKEVDTFHKEVDPAYKRKVEEGKSATSMVNAVALAVLVSSVALSILGILFSSAALVVIGLPVSFLAYNAYRVSENMDYFYNNPKLYMNFNGTCNEEKLEQKLSEGTFLFDPFVKMAVADIKSRLF